MLEAIVQLQGLSFKVLLSIDKLSPFITEIFKYNATEIFEAAVKLMELIVRELLQVGGNEYNR